jgi:hypothetical protein
MTRPDLIAAVLADPEAVREVVEALRSGRVKVAEAWTNGKRYELGVTNPSGYPFIAGQCLPLMESCSCQINDPWQHWYHDGPESEALREIDTRLRAAGWLLCGEGE